MWNGELIVNKETGNSCVFRKILFNLFEHSTHETPQYRSVEYRQIDTTLSVTLKHIPTTLTDQEARIY